MAKEEKKNKLTQLHRYLEAVKCMGYRFPACAIERILHIQSDNRHLSCLCLNDQLDNVQKRFTFPEFKLVVGQAVRTFRLRY